MYQLIFHFRYVTRKLRVSKIFFLSLVLKYKAKIKICINIKKFYLKKCSYFILFNLFNILIPILKIICTLYWEKNCFKKNLLKILIGVVLLQIIRIHKNECVYWVWKWKRHVHWLLFGCIGMCVYVYERINVSVFAKLRMFKNFHRGEISCKIFYFFLLLFVLAVLENFMYSNIAIILRVNKEYMLFNIKIFKEIIFLF